MKYRSGIQIILEYPSIPCGVCNRSNLTPAGMRDGNKPAREFTIRRIDSQHAPTTYEIVSCATEAELLRQANESGWRVLAAAGGAPAVEPVLVCPPCQELIRQAAEQWEPAELVATPPRCAHERLNEDGICRACGADCRGSG